MNLTKVISSSTDSYLRRVIKFLRLGKSDVQTSVQAGPYGVDAVPVQDMIAVFAPTGEKGKTVILGYLNKNSLAGIGEHRIFSTDENGEQQTYIWLKNDGSIEVGGNADNAVRYSALETAFQELQDAFNQHVQNYNLHIHTLGASPTTGPSIGSGFSTGDITAAKIDEIKVP
jgi:hypothetical protein